MTLQITGLSKTYPNGVRALKDLSLTVGNNMFGLLGPNGAGKSSLHHHDAGGHADADHRRLLAPGEVLTLTFSVGHESRGFRDGNEPAQFACNGTFFDTEFFPAAAARSTWVRSRRWRRAAIRSTPV